MNKKNLLFYYRIEKTKGYIPSDKIRVHGTVFEVGFLEKIVSKDIIAEWKKTKQLQTDGLKR